MPAPGCSYPNPVRDANNCITGCGSQVCTPPAPVCGNGITEAPETCDAGSQNGLTCTITVGQTYCDYCSTSCNTIRSTAPVVTTPYVPPVTPPVIDYCAGVSTSFSSTPVLNGYIQNGHVFGAWQYSLSVSGNSFTLYTEQLIAGSCKDISINGQICANVCAPQPPTDPYAAAGYSNAVRQCLDSGGTWQGPVSATSGYCTKNGVKTFLNINPVCGNGITEAPTEQCDLGGANEVGCDTTNLPYGGSCQYCLKSCYLGAILGPRCGDGYCDYLKNGESATSCPSDCTQSTAATNCINSPGNWEGLPSATSGYCTKNGVRTFVTGSVISGNAVRSITENAIGITGNVVGSPYNIVLNSPGYSFYWFSKPTEIRATFNQNAGAQITQYPLTSIEYTVFGNNWASRGEVWNNKPGNDPSKVNLIGNYDSNNGVITVPFPDLPGKGTYSVIVTVTQLDSANGKYIKTGTNPYSFTYDPITLNDFQPRQGQKVSTLPIPVSVQLSSDMSGYTHYVRFSLDDGKINSTMTRKTLNLYEGTITQISKSGTNELTIFVGRDSNDNLRGHKSFKSVFNYNPSSVTDIVPLPGPTTGPTTGSGSSSCYYDKGGPWVILALDGSSLSPGGRGDNGQGSLILTSINAKVGDTLSLETNYHSGGAIPGGIVSVSSSSSNAFTKTASYSTNWAGTPGPTTSLQETWKLSVTSAGSSTYTVSHPGFPNCNWVFNVLGVDPSSIGGGGTGGGGSVTIGGGGTVNIGECVSMGGRWDHSLGTSGGCVIGGGGTTGTGGGGSVTIGGGGGGGSVTVGTTPICTLGNADCGNGLKEPGEICDAGSANGQVCNPQYGKSCDYCTATCTAASVTGPSCGDGIRQTNVVQQTGGGINEDCDLGSQNGLVGPGTGYCQYCSNSCSCVTNNIGPYCGDLQCNNGESYLSCPSDCSQIPAQCGNGVTETGETCDSGLPNGETACAPGYGQACNYCPATCQLTTIPGGSCGDGTCQAGSENAINCPISSGGDCPLVGPICGNNIREGTEQCDLGSANNIPCSPIPAYTQGPSSCTYCLASCTSATNPALYCGDTICTNGQETQTTCPSDCLLPGPCDNGILNLGEACDDGNANTNSCTPSYNFASSQSCTYCRTNFCDRVTLPGGPFCGDGVCSLADGETTSNCPVSQGKDCLDDITPPNCPTAFSAIVTNQTAITLSWNHNGQDNPGGDGLSGFRLYRTNSLTAQSAIALASPLTYFVSGNSFTDNNANVGLSPGTTYYYTIGVIDVRDNLALCHSLDLTNTTLLNAVVGPPFNFSINSPTVGQVLNTSTVQFSVALNQLGGNVKYSLSKGLTNLTMSVDGTGFVFTDTNTGFVNGQYNMTVYAQNASGAKLTGVRPFTVTIASAISGVQVDLASGWNYFSVPESTTAVVGSGLSQGVAGVGSGPDKELAITTGWNLIGYSGVNDVPQASLQFKGLDGNYKDLNTASREKRVQKRFVEYSADSQSFVYSTNTITEEGKAYWVYGREAGQLKAPSVGAPSQTGLPVRVQDIQFQNETSGEIKTLTDAFTVGWIGRTGETTGSLVRYWDTNLGNYRTVSLTQIVDNWKGYVVWSNSRDVKMIVPNA